MSTKTIVAALAALVVVGGGAWYLSSSGSSSTGTMMGTTEEKETAGTGTFAELVGRAGSWTCNVTTSIENAPSEGVSYVADGKIRADFTSTIQGESVTSHMISADGYVYTWSDAYPQGMKMKIPENGEQSTSSGGGFDYDSRVEYDCAPWAKDTSKFTPPSTVSFMELGASAGAGASGNVQMPQLPEGIPVPY